jgi:hypothetical protein
MENSFFCKVVERSNFKLPGNTFEEIDFFMKYLNKHMILIWTYTSMNWLTNFHFLRNWQLKKFKVIRSKEQFLIFF